MNSFPYESWEEAGIAARELDEGFFTFGSTGAVVLTILGILLMVGCFIAWVVTEDRNLTHSATKLRAELLPQLDAR